MASVTTPSHSGDKITLFINDNLVFDSSSGASALPVSFSTVDSASLQTPIIDPRFYQVSLYEQTSPEEKVPKKGNPYVYQDPKTQKRYKLGIFFGVTFIHDTENISTGGVSEKIPFIKVELSFTNKIFKIWQNFDINYMSNIVIDNPKNLLEYLPYADKNISDNSPCRENFMELLQRIYNFDKNTDNSLPNYNIPDKVRQVSQTGRITYIGGSLYRKTKKFNKSNKTKKSRKSNKTKKH